MNKKILLLGLSIGLLGNDTGAMTKDIKKTAELAHDQKSSKEVLEEWDPKTVCPRLWAAGLRIKKTIRGQFPFQLARFVAQSTQIWTVSRNPKTHLPDWCTWDALQGTLLKTTTLSHGAHILFSDDPQYPTQIFDEEEEEKKDNESIESLTLSNHPRFVLLKLKDKKSLILDRASNKNGSISIRDPQNYEELGTITAHTPIKSLSLSSDGNLMATRDINGAVQIWKSFCTIQTREQKIVLASLESLAKGEQKISLDMIVKQTGLPLQTLIPVLNSFNADMKELIKNTYHFTVIDESMINYDDFQDPNTVHYFKELP
jgi:hypothetical protein